MKSSQWGELQNLLADLRDKAANNAESGDQDERQAWFGFSKEISRAMRMHTRNRSICKSVVDHWNEFGHDYGFDELVHRLEEATNED